MIDKEKVKAFWDARARKYGAVPYDSIANLEQDADSLALKVELETEKVFEFLGSVESKTVLDLGAGVGQWSFRFVDRGAKEVLAVEYSAELAAIGQSEVEARGVSNVRFVVSPAERFSTDRTFDVVFISGLFVYLTDDQADEVLSRLPGVCHPDTIVLLRDGTGLETRHEIDDRLSGHLQTRYSATYRTAAVYERLFADHGFRLLRSENMFAEGCVLNKYPETRLRIYEFSLGGSD
ncbi:MAG: class I SAM-dependent methyltransferase [Thermoanaerobaculia bacterium]|nr:class I SAM-dependent methyltransferase [Thermoanaerobaculia bacterium]